MASLSVVIPLYNKRAFIGAAVASVLAQDHPAFELIVIDDGSTDGSTEVLTSLNDPRMRIVIQPNSGVASARNCGIAEAHHDWIAFLDADDWWKPTHLSELALLVETHPEAVLIATRVQQVRGTRLIDRDRIEPQILKSIDYFAEAARNILIVHTSATAARRDVLLRIGGFRDLRPGQDIDCWARLALGGSVVVSNQQTAYYSRDTGGAMARWAANTDAPKTLFHSLRQFGGAVASLSQALESGDHESKRQSIEAYIDARILSGARKRLSVGDNVDARNRLRFVHSRMAPAYWSYRLIAALPTRSIPVGVSLFRSLRALLRKRRP